MGKEKGRRARRFGVCAVRNDYAGVEGGASFVFWLGRRKTPVRLSWRLPEHGLITAMS